MDETEKHVHPNPVATANPVSKLFFWWLNPLFRQGYKRPLEVEDMYNVVEEDSSDYVGAKLEREWENELAAIKDGRKPSLRRAITRAFGRSFIYLGLIVLLEESIKVIQPLLLGGLIRYFNPDSGMTTRDAYVYAGVLSICALVVAIVHHPYFYSVQRIGMWLRIGCCSLIYKKSLRLSNSAMGKTTTGQIVNLLSNDVNRFDMATLFLHFLWIGPLQAIAVLVILWLKLGPASLSGFAILILLIPVQGSMGKLFGKLRRKTAVLTDERVRVMNEILTGIRVIKMYCWEKMFGELVSKVRSREVKKVRSARNAQAFTLAPFFSSAKLIGYITFLTFILSGNTITAEIVFVTVALYNPVRLIMTLFIPFAIQITSETNVTIKRLQEFLLLQELEHNTSIVRPTERPKPADCKVTALNITASWDKNVETKTLDDISFEVRAGELLAVIGPVGAGKSSLLMSLLGELPLSSGSVKVSGKVAYASQQPWVFSASVRQNIVFGQPFNLVRYQKSIRASGLTRDLEIMPDGDKTLVGERGVTISGGQKARVSLARALYFNADIYLLDDPLSAVDTAVGKHIFDKCICEVLKDKPRILVTHQLQYLEKADRIIVLKEGKVMSMGTFQELAQSGVDFASLLKRPESNSADDIVSPINSPSSEVGTLEDCTIHGDNTDNYLSKSLDPYSCAAFTDVREPLFRTPKTKPKVHRSLYNLAKLGGSHHSLDSLPKLSGGLHKRRMSKSLSTLYRSPISHTKSVESLSRQAGSMISLGSMDLDREAEFVAPIQEEEKRSVGTVGAKTYLQYFWAGGGVISLTLLLVFNLACQGAYIMCDMWLSYWSEKQETSSKLQKEHDRLVDLGHNITNVTVPNVDTNFYIYIYTGITASVFIFGLLRALLMFRVLVTSSKVLHGRMFSSIIRSPVLFFDTNPIGRVLNRFSKDMGLLDENLPVTMFDFIQCLLVIVGIVLVAGAINPWVFIPVTPLCILFLIIRKYYLQTARDIKRLEGTTRSPVFSHVSASLQGLHTIRAFQCEEKFIAEFSRHQDQHTEAWFLFLSTSRWFAIRLDTLCALFVMSVAFCSVFASESLNGGLVGLTLTYAIGLTGLFQWGVRQSAEVENQMTSVERVLEYCKLPSEAPLDSEPSHKPPPSWPTHGIITAEKASFTYTDDGPSVLRNLNFCFRAQEKVGIVGRTGAGKSSLITMLFRMAEPKGIIRIDGLDIKDMGLHDLRMHISIIPQDPVLFTGSVRKNLDPFSQHSDSALWDALEEVQLKPAIQDLPGNLEAEISEGGVNFSVGQRQLICLARAVLHRNKILVIDEATANVDPRTDSLIQQTIRQKFKQCTVLTIAHRLHTIMDSDRVLVLDAGEIKEFDEPYTLLQDEESLFYKMVEQTGKQETEHLLDIAKEAYLIRNQPDPTSIIPDSKRTALTSTIENGQNGSESIV